MYSFLALGDSYTIGEQLPLIESFPYQTVQLLRKGCYHFYAPEILAKTGWTTDELATAADSYPFLKSYDFVTLLIGVNNQYRGRSVEEFEIQFSGLLSLAIRLSGENRERVVVLSIPDWGLTPFAEGREKEKISAEIDLFNAACNRIAVSERIHFIDITASQRKDVADESFLAADKLHPSGKEYAKWAEAVSEWMSEILKKG